MSCGRWGKGFWGGWRGFGEGVWRPYIEYAIVYADGIYWENMRRIFVWEICEEGIDFSLHSIYNVFTRLVWIGEKHNDKG